MIRVLIERHAQEGRRFLTLLREIRAEAMKQPGYVSGETLVDANDMYKIAVISTWNSIRDWKAWQKSKLRVGLDQKIEAYLVEPTRVTVFRYLSYRQTV
ncbi:antibiotic biosynthesis monooxygenase family protein [Chloroflexota bacterium]